MAQVISVNLGTPRPATHWDVTFTETLGTTPSVNTIPHTWNLHVGGSFSDIDKSYVFYSQIETLLHNGVTLGAAPGDGRAVAGARQDAAFSAWGSRSCGTVRGIPRPGKWCVWTGMKRSPTSSRSPCRSKPQ